MCLLFGVSLRGSTVSNSYTHVDQFYQHECKGVARGRVLIKLIQSV